MTGRNIPVPEPEKEDREYLFPSASFTDMTGIVPANNDPVTVSEEYQDIYPYLPKQ